MSDGRSSSVGPSCDQGGESEQKPNRGTSLRTTAEMRNHDAEAMAVFYTADAKFPGPTAL